MSCVSSCVGGVLVFVMAYIAICSVLLEDILTGYMFYLRVCIIGGHVLQLILFHWNTCFAGGHI